MIQKKCIFVIFSVFPKLFSNVPRNAMSVIVSSFWTQTLLLVSKVQSYSDRYGNTLRLKCVCSSTCVRRAFAGAAVKLVLIATFILVMTLNNKLTNFSHNTLSHGEWRPRDGLLAEKSTHSPLKESSYSENRLLAPFSDFTIDQPPNVVAGREILFSLETASDYTNNKDMKPSLFYGFRCVVTGNETVVLKGAGEFLWGVCRSETRNNSQVRVAVSLPSGFKR